MGVDPADGGGVLGGVVVGGGVVAGGGVLVADPVGAGETVADPVGVTDGDGLGLPDVLGAGDEEVAVGRGVV